MKTHIINLLPFNNRTEMSRTEYVIKKVLAFILIFFMAGVLGEAVVIFSEFLNRPYSFFDGQYSKVIRGKQQVAFVISDSLI